MTWAIVIQLIAQVGLPLANTILQKWFSNPGASVTGDEWKALMAEASKSGQELMAARLQAAGIDPASEQGKAFLALSVGVT